MVGPLNAYVEWKQPWSSRSAVVPKEKDNLAPGFIYEYKSTVKHHETKIIFKKVEKCCKVITAYSLR